MMDYKRTMLKVITVIMLVTLVSALAVGSVQADVTESTGFGNDGTTTTADSLSLWEGSDVGNGVYPDWKAEYWDNRRLEGDPVLVRNDENINFDWKRGSPAHRVPKDRFSARWTRQMTFALGQYRIFCHADDGFRFSVDGILQLNEWHDFTPNGVYSVDLWLEGVHDLKMEYYERQGVARAYLWWVKIPPDCAISTSAMGVCAGSSGNSASASDAGLGATYVWSVIGGTLQTGQGTRSITWDAGTISPVTISVTVTKDDGRNTECRDSVSVIVYAGPTAVASNGGPYCAGSTIQLIGGPDGMSSYIWTGPNGFTSSQQSPSIPNGRGGDYTLTVTDEHGCTDSATTTVTVYANPIAEASNGGPYCTGNTVQLIGGPDGMASYRWTGPNGYTSAQQSPSRPLAIPDMSGEYVLTVTDEHGCKDSDTTRTTVTIYTAPTAEASNGGPYCAGSMIQLVGGPDGMSSYSWVGPNGFTSSQQSPSIADATTAMAGAYTLTIINERNCMDLATTTVTVNANPTAEASNDGPYCAETTINLIGGPGGMSSYSWTGPNGFTSNQQSPSISDATTAMSGDYLLTVTDQNGCTGSDTTTVTVNAKPTAVASNDGPYCAETTINLIGGPDGMNSYSWVGPNGFASNEQSPSIPDATTAMSGDYVLTITDQNGCTGSDTTTVTVQAKPTAVASNDGPYCAETTINLVGGPDGMSSYSWVGPNGFTSSEQSPSIPDATTAMSGDYVLTVTDDKGCTDSATTTVTVNANPIAVASNDGPYVAGNTVQLIGGPDGMSSYSWTGPNGFTSSEQSPSLSDATPYMVGDYVLTVIDGNGCTDSETTAVRILLSVSLQEGVDGYAGTVDTFINVWDRDTNRGDWGDFWVREDGIKNGLIRFDLSGVFDASYEDVHEASLFLYASGRTNENPVELGAYRVLRHWEEMEATWNEASTGVPWETGGCNAEGIDLDTAPLGRTWLERTRYTVAVDIADAVRAWKEDPGSNFGVVLKSEGMVQVRYAFSSSENSLIERRPELRITYFVSNPLTAGE